MNAEQRYFNIHTRFGTPDTIDAATGQVVAEGYRTPGKEMKPEDAIDRQAFRYLNDKIDGNQKEQKITIGCLWLVILLVEIIHLIIHLI